MHARQRIVARAHVCIYVWMRTINSFLPLFKRVQFALCSCSRDIMHSLILQIQHTHAHTHTHLHTHTIYIHAGTRVLPLPGADHHTEHHAPSDTPGHQPAHHAVRQANDSTIPHRSARRQGR